MIKRSLIITCLLLTLSSCKTIDIGYVQKEKAEQEIAMLREEFNRKLEQSNSAIIAAKDGVIAAKDRQLQAVADSFYGQSVTFKAIIQPTRTDLILMNLSEEGWAAIDHLLPSYEQMIKINERIARELDETKTSLEDLKKQHDEIVIENTRLVEQEKSARELVAAEQRAKSDLKNEFDRQIAAKQDELIEIQQKLIAQEQQRANDAVARHAVLTKLSTGAGSLAALALIGAVFISGVRVECGLIAAGSLFAAVAIWYITPLIILAVIGVVIFAAIGWAFYSRQKAQKELEQERSAATDTYRSLQRVKEKRPDVWVEAVKPELEEGNLRYVEKEGGVIVKERDPEREAFVDKRLAEVGDK